MLTGDLGRTAVLAKSGRLSEASLTPLVPIRFMLASPLGRDEADGRIGFADLPFPPPFWLEPKCDGIRVQLHKFGEEVGLFSQDLRPLDREFPELVAAAESLDGDFILDGELIAHADGRKLAFADLQRTPGRPKAENDLFIGPHAGAASAPLQFVAFDLLWLNGENLLDTPLAGRRERLEALPLEGLFVCVDVFFADDSEGVRSCLRTSLEEGYGGLVAKDPNSAYSPGRTGSAWIEVG
jgi:DNA ligase-1